MNHLGVTASIDPHSRKLIFRRRNTAAVAALAKTFFSLPVNERSRAMEALFQAAAECFGLYPERSVEEGLEIVTNVLTEASLEHRDFTLLNCAYTCQLSKRLKRHERVCVAVLGYFFRYIGRTAVRSRRFGEMLFTDIGETLVPFLTIPRAERVARLEAAIPLPIAIIWETAWSPVSDAAPLKDWLHQLLRLWDRGDQTVASWLDCFLAALMLQAQRPLAIRTMLQLHVEMAEWGFSPQTYLENGCNPRFPKLVLSEEGVSIVRRFLEQRHTTLLHQQRETVRWARSHGEHLRDQLTAVRSDITLRIRKGLNPAGDPVDVSHLTLAAPLGLRFITFKPNGQRLPDTDVMLTFTMMGCVECTFHCWVRDMRLGIPKALLEHFPGRPELCRAALEYLVMVALYRLLTRTAPTSKSRKRRTNSDGSESSGRYIHPYVPHLPEGKQMSLEAEAAHRELYKQLPPVGRTFNRGRVSIGPDGKPLYMPSPPIELKDNHLLA